MIVTNINTTKKYLKNSSRTKTQERLYGNCRIIFFANYEQVFFYWNQWTSFNSMDLYWSFIQNDSDIFRFCLSFLKFLNHVIMVFFNAVFRHIWLAISSMLVFNTFMYAMWKSSGVIVFICRLRTVHMMHHIVLVFKFFFLILNWELGFSPVFLTSTSSRVAF